MTSQRTELATPMPPVRRPPGTPPQSTSTLTFRDIWRMFRRRLWLVVILTALVTMAATALGFVLKRYRPLYASTALVRCKMPVAPDPLQVNNLLPRPELIELQTANQALVLSSDAFLISVLERARVQQTRWYKSRPSEKDRLDGLHEGFAASPRRDTEFVLVSMEASSPDEAQTILEEMLKQFAHDVEERATGELRRNLAALQNQREKFLTELRSRRTDLNLLRAAAKVPAWEQGRSVVMDELRLMNEERILLHAQIQQTDIELRQLLQQKQQGMPSVEVQEMIERNMEVANYRNQLAGLETRLAALNARCGPDHPEVQRTEPFVAEVRQQLQEKEQELFQQYTASREAMLQNRLVTLQLQYEAANERYAEVAAQQTDLDGKYAQFTQLTDEITDINRRLEQFEQRINATQVAIENPERARAEIAAPPTRPLEISFPRIPIFIAGGFFLGLALSVGLVFLLEFADDSVQVPLDVSRHLHVPYLGMIPLYDDAELGETAVELITAEHPHSIVSESFRQIRTNLYFSAPAEELKSFLITGPTPESGKTTTATNLAITLAAENKRVLLVDANFRRPALNRLFAREGMPAGLSNVLVGHNTAADVIHATDLEGLDVIDAGPTPPNPAVLLSSERMASFLASQRSYYDTVIIDGPPALLVTDARILASLVDGVILVVRAKETSRGLVGRMIRELRSPKINILGVLLNGVKPQKGGYFREAYDTYHRYVAAPNTPALPPTAKQAAHL